MLPSKQLPLVHFKIELQPIPKQRARSNRERKSFYTPPRTREWENTVKQYASLAMRSNDEIQGPLQGDLALVLTFHRKGKRRADLDNLVKSIKDGMNGIVYDDDKQVVRSLLYLRYEQTPSVEIMVFPARLFDAIIDPSLVWELAAGEDTPFIF